MQTSALSDEAPVAAAQLMKLHFATMGMKLMADSLCAAQIHAMPSSKQAILSRYHATVTLLSPHDSPFLGC